jgi:hypothetical protein
MVASLSLEKQRRVLLRVSTATSSSDELIGKSVVLNA